MPNRERLDAREILRTDELERRGVLPWKETRRAQARLARVRRGGYVAAQRWAELDDANRYRGLVISTFSAMKSDPPPMACGHSAAALCELPVLGRWPDRVQVLTDSSAAGSTGLIQRHRVADLPEPASCHGIPVTPVPRTVVDLARAGTLAHGLVLADAALRLRKCTLAELDDEIARIPPGGRGRRRAALAIHLADGRAESPGESLSRARMHELGLPQPDLQVPLADERGVFGFADFGWEGLIGEFDGELKYAEPGVLWKEKRREDRVRRTRTGVARWVWRDALLGEPLRRILYAAGLRPASDVEWRRWDPARQPVRAHFTE